MSPKTIMALGFALVLAGFVLPFLMVLRVLESGFFLSFTAHVTSLIGLLLALYGAFEHLSSTRHRY